MTDIDSKEITQVKRPSTPDDGAKDATEIDRPALVALETAEVAPPDLEASVIDKNKRSKNLAFGSITIPPDVAALQAQRIKEAGLQASAPKPVADDANVTGTRLKPAVDLDRHDTTEMPTVPREKNAPETIEPSLEAQRADEGSQPPSTPTPALTALETTTLRVPRRRRSRAVWTVAGVVAVLSFIVVMALIGLSPGESEVVSTQPVTPSTAEAPSPPSVAKPAAQPAAVTAAPEPREVSRPVAPAPAPAETSSSVPDPIKTAAPRKPKPLGTGQSATPKKPAPATTAAPKSSGALPKGFSETPGF